ncbi:hypothetical protein EDD29_1417 [Actinocorallia herbida]|uniref:HEAT repeat protein n=1 Tax=Actinocorallia herbida TaxID=58109 RepID=A0A3N1CRG5_9ACTN|nr:hypothetical protein [Actinocorallia herbida]ROO83907.1 hypothetical protein EDD29_1417 [Actinocorallia herbida]
MGRPLSELDAVDWSALHHAYGDASDVPGLLRALGGTDEEAAEEAFGALFAALCHQGSRFDASAAAVPFLAGLLENPLADVPGLILLGRLATGDDDQWSLPRPAEISGDPDLDPDALAAYEAVRREVPGLVGFLGDGDPYVVRAAAWALSWFPEEAGAVLPPLHDVLSSAPLPATRTTCLLAAALLGDRALFSLPVPDGDWPYATAALLALRDDPPAAVVDAVLDAARTLPKHAFQDDDIPYFYGDVPGVLASALRCAPAARRREAAVALTRLRQRTGHSFPIDAGLVHLLLEEAAATPGAHLSPLERAHLAALPRHAAHAYPGLLPHALHSLGLPDAFPDLASLLASRGLPSFP